MKKFTVAIIALALVMSLSVPAFAANPTGAQTDLSFTYTAAVPSYTVTIPGTLDLVLGYNNLPVIVAAAQNLGGKTVTITFEGTQAFDLDHYVYDLWPNGISSVDNARYALFTAGDNIPVVSTSSKPVGHILADFTDNGTQEIVILVPSGQSIVPDVPYTGSITFGIKLV